ncbi:MAG TPA: hypothetical protein VFJ21_00120 [Mycobacteriales bacterium]|nr:hypothetical protein [Mycobacteriales bacterium]
MTDDKLSSSNQGKPEPVPVSPTRPAAQSTVASAHPQAPRPDTGSGADRSAAPRGDAGSREDSPDSAAETSGRTTPPAERQSGGSPTQAAQEARPLAQGKAAGTNPASRAVVGRSGAPDGEVSPR